jgi:guanylate kinase
MLSEQLIILISGPSGCGKSTLIERLLAEDQRIRFSVSVTTRAPRVGEVHGRDYSFVTEQQFDRLVADDAFVEWAHVYGHRYGTPRSEVARIHLEGHDALFDLDSVGGRNLMRLFPDTIPIFVLPPRYQALRQRLVARGKDSNEIIEQRLGMVYEQGQECFAYRHVVVNDDLDVAFADLTAILRAERCRLSRNRERVRAILETFHH